MITVDARHRTGLGLTWASPGITRRDRIQLVSKRPLRRLRIVHKGGRTSYRIRSRRPEDQVAVSRRGTVQGGIRRALGTPTRHGKPPYGNRCQGNRWAQESGPACMLTTRSR